MSIADNIKFLRKQKNLTQKQLAEKSGLAVITIQQYEAGKYEPKQNSLYKLRKALDCNIYEILNKPFELLDISIPDFEELEELMPDNIKISNKSLELFEHKLLDNYRLLNEEGKKEANKRVEELTEIPRYTKKEE